MKLKIALLFFVFIASSVMAHENVLTVQGQSVISATPDQLHFTISLEEKGPSTAKLKARTDEKTRLIVNLLRSNGVKKEDIQSMRVQLQPWYERTPEGNRQSGFVFTRQINVVLRELEDYTKVIDGILNIGAHRIDRFEYVSTQSADAYKKALQQAVLDARNTASLLAEQAGIKLGKVLSIHEQYSSHRPTAMKMMAMAEDSASLPGQLGVNASVQVTFEIN